MAEEKTETAAPAAAPAAGAPPKLVLMLTAVNVLFTIGIAVVMFLSFKKEQTKPALEDISVTEEHKEKQEGKEGAEGHGGEGAAKGGHEGTQDYGKMVTLEQFTINLNTAGSVNPKFARVNISVEVPTEDAELEVNQKMPQVRNTIIDLFNSKKPADLATPEGRNYLKEEIRNALNSFLVSGQVKGVFFTNFALSS